MEARSGPPASKERPVVIVGTAPRVALTVARSLARRGIRVVTVPSSEDEGRILSRAIAEYAHLPDARLHPAEFDRGLEAVVRRTGADLLMACSDKALAAIARNYDALHVLADPGVPPPAVAARVLDKRATIDAARSLGIGVPATFDLEDTRFDRASLLYPAIAKPKDHTTLGGLRIRYLADGDDLADAMRDDPSFAERYLLQQFVPGVGVGVAVLMKGGEPLAVFCHRRLKELPAAGGVSVVSESTEPDPALVTQSVGLLRALGWEGIALVEYRRADDGRTWLMEINGRYWGSLSTAVEAGVDFPFYQWQVAHGQTPEPPRTYPAAVRVRWTRGAILRLRERLFEHAGFGTTRGRGADELRTFWADFSPDVRSALWSAGDPIPAIVDVMPGLSRFTGSALRAAVKAMIPRGVRRAHRSLGLRGAARYVGSSMLGVVGLGRSGLPRPFAPRSVLFVCSGNIMRSPLAAAVFRSTLRELGATGVVVDSSGLHTPPGRPADPRAIEAATQAGVSLDDHRSKPMSAELARDFEAIFVMDRVQQLELEDRFAACAAKTYILGVQLPGVSAVEIDDPYLADAKRCAAILTLVRERAAGLARLLANDLKAPMRASDEPVATDATEPGAT